jgi:hydrogenase nickel incorporation protein HypB
MCDTCGCNITPGNEHLVTGEGKHAKTADGRAAISVLQSLLSENDHQAAHNREHFDRHGVLALNLMSSPGAGKTSLLESTIDALAGRLRVAVIEGDLETENDAERIRAKGVPAIQIATGSACHLDAHMVHDALHALDLDGVDILFIENVGNLVCPASFDLGQHRNITLLSVPEGDDKPAKYPVMFRSADLVLCTKADFLPLLPEFSVERAERHLRALASVVPFETVSTRGEGHLRPWLDWLEDELAAQRARLEFGRTTRPSIQPGAPHRHAKAADPHRHGHTHHEDQHQDPGRGHAHRHGDAHDHSGEPTHARAEPVVARGQDEE